MAVDLRPYYMGFFAIDNVIFLEVYFSFVKGFTSYCFIFGRKL
jgi:hypothetical protein